MARKAGVGGFVFEPRSVAESPTQFGQTALALKRGAGVDEGSSRYQAADLQHRVANAVREALAIRGQNLKEYVASIPGDDRASYDRLIRIQRGETMMQLTDLFVWARLFPNVQSLLAAEAFGYEESDDF